MLSDHSANVSGFMDEGSLINYYSHLIHHYNHPEKNLVVQVGELNLTHEEIIY
jgi:hypothetical protein